MTPQQPIDSGFGLRSTPSDILEGRDLSGMFAVVTGGYSGLGYETTKALVHAGADVLVPARRPDHAAEVLAPLAEASGSVSVETMDLGVLQSVRACAQRIVAQGRSIDIAINNAARPPTASSPSTSMPSVPRRACVRLLCTPAAS